MRPLLFLLLIPAVFAQLAEPPVSPVVGNNTELAPSLDGVYYPDIAYNSTIDIVFGSFNRSLPVSASLDIAGLTLLLDNRTYPHDDLSLLIVRGEELGELISLPAAYPDFACDRLFFEWISDETSWRCDFEPDFCSEFVNRSYVDYNDTVVSFSFRNVSENVTLSSTLIPVPSAVLEEMQDASGAEPLNVTISGNITFKYEVNDRGFIAAGPVGDCGSNYYFINKSVPVSLNRSFNVSGTQKLFFLRSPVLREQWFRNNRFNTVLLSQASIYSASIEFDGNQTANFTLRSFWVEENFYGVQEIFSNITNESGWKEWQNLTHPVPLQTGNSSYAFIYEFNHSYDALGPHSLSLVVEDSFEGSARYDEVLASRMLSYKGTLMENGSAINQSVSRKSVGFQPGTLTSIYLTFGLLALIILLAFFNFWLRD